MLGLRAAPSGTGTNYAVQLFAQILGGSISSRLWQEVREKRGLAYSVDAFHWPFSDTACSASRPGFPRATRRPSWRSRSTRCARRRRASPKAELARAKAQVKVGLLAALETPAGRIERLARQQLAWGGGGGGRIVPMHELVERVETGGRRRRSRRRGRDARRRPDARRDRAAEDAAAARVDRGAPVGLSEPRALRRIPPSTRKSCEVQALDTSEARNSASSATSRPTRRRGRHCRARISASRSGVIHKSSCFCVRIAPGTMALTRTRSRPNSRASWRVSPRTALLGRGVGGEVGHAEHVGGRADVHDRARPPLRHVAERGLGREELVIEVSPPSPCANRRGRSSPRPGACRWRRC